MKRLLLSAAIFALALAGCAPNHSIVGKWKATEGMGPDTSMTVEYSDKDKVEISTLAKQRVSNKSLSIYGEIKGTYTLKGDQLMISANNVKFTCPDMPDELKDVMDKQLRTLTEETKWKMNDEGSVAITWTDADTFSFTGKSGKAQTFTRVK